MQIRKPKRVSLDSSKADRVLNFLISVLALLVFAGMGLLLHISIVAAQPEAVERPITAVPMTETQELAMQGSAGFRAYKRG
ncbi:hypothetical protein [Pseudovibrio sp. Tun.PSC04-5.I4]|uniref:hypothetical protein n=1 Tax=Pseudovibrio sp. Tun.PSC04-5.I4 TaxID=1798213 RepID=UPI00087EBA64|nr:hypothetical protein [Pseudovibrio sp. Tun.PSC04-5.I4]SDR35468.1 hypothetical protein SAMN04515695_4862 [Pseudovibrio sp. Tun.PSC04-5.I4]